MYKDLHTRFYDSQRYIVREYKRNNIVYASAVCAQISFYHFVFTFRTQLTNESQIFVIRSWFFSSYSSDTTKKNGKTFAVSLINTVTRQHAAQGKKGVGRFGEVRTARVAHALGHPTRNGSRTTAPPQPPPPRPASTVSTR